MPVLLVLVLKLHFIFVCLSTSQVLVSFKSQYSLLFITIKKKAKKMHHQATSWISLFHKPLSACNGRTIELSGIIRSPFQQSFLVAMVVSIGTYFVQIQWQDYAMESDETRIFNAAHLMVASLAGSLAHVTCKVMSHT